MPENTFVEMIETQIWLPEERVITARNNLYSLDSGLFHPLLYIFIATEIEHRQTM